MYTQLDHTYSYIVPKAIVPQLERLVINYQFTVWHFCSDHFKVKVTKSLDTTIRYSTQLVWHLSPPPFPTVNSRNFCKRKLAKFPNKIRVEMRGRYPRRIHITYVCVWSAVPARRSSATQVDMEPVSHADVPSCRHFCSAGVRGGSIIVGTNHRVR